MVPKVPAQEVHPDFGETVIRVVPGAVYRFAGHRAPDKPDRPPMYVYPPGDYRLVGVGRDVVTWQELCCFCQGEPGDGNLFFCSLVYWADNFTLVSDQAAPEKTVDFTTKGSGV